MSGPAGFYTHEGVTGQRISPTRPPTLVDLARCELRLAGKPVELTALEFKLLLAFVAHRSKVLSRAQLLDLVWGRDTFVTDRVVDNHVVALRRKIEPEPGHPRYLLSIRGLGYRFDA